MKMKAVYLSKPWEISIMEREKPVPQPGEALIRIMSAGICGSDIGAFRGTNGLVTYPRTIGHELAGIIEEIPADNKKGLKAGDKVILDPYIYCGDCYPCTAGNRHEKCGCGKYYCRHLCGNTVLLHGP